MINIRYKKRAKSNDYSVYLDIYIPKNKETNTPSKREYEFLNIYVSKDYSKEKRIVGTDKENIELAKSIAAKREIEIKNNEYGFKQANKNVDFFKFYERNENLKIYRYTALLKHLKDFAKSETIYFSDLTNDFLISFTNYLLSKTEPKINQTTIHGYLVALKTCFNRAIKQGIIQSNPMQNIEIPKAVETQRTTLELSELQLLKETKPKMNIIGETQLRQAFFFSCFTGLRLSDIQRITWNDLKDNQIPETKNLNITTYHYRKPLCKYSLKLIKTLPIIEYFGTCQTKLH
jgi:integrase